jgi:hypothetical protein
VHFSFSAFARLSFSFCFEQMSDDIVRRVEGGRAGDGRAAPLRLEIAMKML